MAVERKDRLLLPESLEDRFLAQVMLLESPSLATGMEGVTPMSSTTEADKSGVGVRGYRRPRPVYEGAFLLRRLVAQQVLASEDFDEFLHGWSEHAAFAVQDSEGAVEDGSCYG